MSDTRTYYQVEEKHGDFDRWLRGREINTLEWARDMLDFANKKYNVTEARIVRVTETREVVSIE